MHYVEPLDQGFPGAALLTFWTREFFWLRGASQCPVGSHTNPGESKMSPNIAKCPLGGKNHPDVNHCFRGRLDVTADIQ